jgi:hypothetical protein
LIENGNEHNLLETDDYLFRMYWHHREEGNLQYYDSYDLEEERLRLIFKQTKEVIIVEQNPAARAFANAYIDWFWLTFNDIPFDYEAVDTVTITYDFTLYPLNGTAVPVHNTFVHHKQIEEYFRY